MVLLAGMLLCAAFFCLFFGQPAFHLTTQELALCAIFSLIALGVFLFLCHRLLDLPSFRRLFAEDDTFSYRDPCKIRDFQPNDPDEPDRQRFFNVIDSSGVWLNEHSYNHLSSFREGVAVAGRRIILGKDGQELCHFSGDSRIALHHHFHEGFAPFCHYAERNQAWGFLTPSGEKVIKAQFTHARSFHDGRAAVEISGKWGYIDTHGEMIIKPRFFGMHFPAHDFHQGLAAVFTGEAWGYINPGGELVIPASYSHAEDFSEHLAFVRQGENHGYIDPTGKLVIDLGPCLGKAFVEGLARFRDQDRWGFIDHTGKRVIEPEYRQARDFSEGLVAVQCLNLENRFVNRHGSVVVPGIFAEAKSFREGLAPVRQEQEQWGFIDREVQYLISPRFEFAEPFSEGFALVSRPQP